MAEPWPDEIVEAAEQAVRANWMGRRNASAQVLVLALAAYRARASKAEDRIRELEQQLAESRFRVQELGQQLKRVNRDGVPGQMHAVDRAFYEETVRQRDRAWQEIDKLGRKDIEWQPLEVARLRAIEDAAKALLATDNRFRGKELDTLKAALDAEKEAMLTELRASQEMR